ncbi:MULTISPECIES: hypothetical protein [Streptomyces]|uniref:hypothetical protein n=1 Tax=Streptomyces TaxID=1883 RepID=UPI0033E960F6
MPDGPVAWLVTKHELARKLLADPRVSADRLHPAFPGRLTAEQRAATEQSAGSAPGGPRSTWTAPSTGPTARS